MEDHPEAVKGLRRNLESLGLRARRPGPASAGGRGLEKVGGPGERFGLVFLDPPYGGGMAAATLAALASLDLLRPAAYVVAEHSPRETLPESSGAADATDLRRYGDTQVAFYRTRINLTKRSEQADA